MREKFIIIALIVIIFIIIGVSITKKSENQLEIINDKRAIEINNIYESRKVENGKIPQIQGDYIQMWYCRTWSQNDWDKHFRELKNVNMEYIIMQILCKTENGKFIEIASSGKTIPKEYFAEECIYDYEAFKKALEAARKNDIQLFIGVTYSDEWFEETNVLTKSWRDKQIDLLKMFIDDLKKDKILTEYMNEIYGWYIPYEFYTTTNNDVIDAWAELYNGIINVLTYENASMPIMCSPFINTYQNISIEDTKKCFTKIAENFKLRKGIDIVALQDGFEILKEYDVEYAADCVKAISEVFKTKGVRFWITVEAFEDGKATSLERIAAQMKVDNLYAEKMVMFSYTHYFSSKVSRVRQAEYLNKLERYFK